MEYEEFEDYYNMLSLSPLADDDDIRKAYRRAVRKYHPDTGGVGTSIQKFKDVVRAYQVLIDTDSRRIYDERYAIRHGHWGKNPENSADGSGSGKQEGANDSSAQDNGAATTIKNEKGEARESGPNPNSERSKPAVEVEDQPGAFSKSSRPSKVESGKSNWLKESWDLLSTAVRESGLVLASHLYCYKKIPHHPLLRREGFDLVLRVPLTLYEGIHGITVDVPTLDGLIKVSIPCLLGLTKVKLRVKNRGLKKPFNWGRGNIFIEPHIVLPPKVDPELTIQASVATAKYPDHVRKELFAIFIESNLK